MPALLVVPPPAARGKPACFLLRVQAAAAAAPLGQQGQLVPQPPKLRPAVQVLGALDEAIAGGQVSLLQSVLQVGRLAPCGLLPLG